MTWWKPDALAALSCRGWIAGQGEAAKKPPGYIRADGQMIHDFYLYEVKKPEESKKPWDFLKQVAVIPGDKAFDPLSASTCNLLKK